MRTERLIIVSNRGPFQLHLTKRGVKRQMNIGGLVTSLLPMIQMTGGVWIAWGEPEGTFPDSSRKPSFTLRYISLTPEQIRDYYHGLANSALWPLAHYFLGRVHYDNAQWKTYQEVNHKFAQATLAEALLSDVIWVHDYHLALVPGLIRRERAEARLAFFWHIPFPSVEIYRTLPWRRAVLESLLTSDLIGFHIPEYAENFVEAAVELLDAKVEGECIQYGGRMTRVLARPIGIDYHAVERQARSARTLDRVRHMQQTLHGQRLILGVERMDYTKGILERLRSFEYLLEHEPAWRGTISLIQIVTPSRQDVDAYRQKRREIDEIVGRINGRFSDGIWMPIRYMYRSLSLQELVAYYSAAEVALVTPLRDGLNLVAKEYIATRINSDGVLILSEFAGVAHQLPEALMVNPYSIEEMAATLERALTMPKDVQRQRMQAMQARIKAHDITWWAREFLDSMKRC